MAELLAKPDIPLLIHLEEVTRLGAEIAGCMQLQVLLRAKVLLACALHDIGKATLSFQGYMKAVRMVQEAERCGAPTRELERLQRIARQKKTAAYPHALASLPFMVVVERTLHTGQERGACTYEATAAVLTHHSPLGPELYKGYEATTYHYSELKQVLQEIWELLKSYNVQGLPPVEAFWEKVQLFLKNSPAALLETPFSVNGGNRTLRGILQKLPTQDFAQVKAVLHLADWLASAKKPCSTALFLNNGNSLIEQHMQKLGNQLTDFQRRAKAASDKNILWLRAPTGTGKTEALLLWAGNTERLIYLLPTQATTNAMWRRLRCIYGEDMVGLSHGRASYMLRRESDEDPLDMRLFGSVFAKPVTVATLDQYLLAHLHGRHWEERRTLARKATVVMDEIHAYEPYTLGLLLEALEREPPARLALSSATFPEQLLELFPKGQLIEAELGLWHRNRHRLERRNGMLQEEGVEEALRFARSGKRVLMITNTVRGAQALYRKLCSERGWEKLRLLHSRFVFRDRMQKEAEVGHPEPGMIFVATQVVEVSLDISYDVLITEVAPIDALVQRMGRINRWGELPPAPVLVYQEPSKGSERIYGEEVLSWTSEILSTLPETPTDIDLVQATNRLYKKVVSTEEWKQELEEGRKTLDEVQRILGCYTIDLSDEEMQSRFATRRGMISVEVIPADFVNQAYQLKEARAGWKLPELLVPVPIWWLKEGKEFFSYVSDLQLLQTNLSYSPEEGLLAPDEQADRPLGVFLV
jgi:CRISPR-associated endonuclease/helicase Cas3